MSSKKETMALKFLSAPNECVLAFFRVRVLVFLYASLARCASRVYATTKKERGERENQFAWPEDTKRENSKDEFEGKPACLLICLFPFRNLQRHF